MKVVRKLQPGDALKAGSLVLLMDMQSGQGTVGKKALAGEAPGQWFDLCECYELEDDEPGQEQEATNGELRPPFSRLMEFTRSQS